MKRVLRMENFMLFDGVFSHSDDADEQTLGAINRAVSVLKDTGRGEMPRPMRKPIIYFAGRMDASKRNKDWRNVVGDGLRWELYDTATGGNFPAEKTIDCRDFWYGGPYVLDNLGGHGRGHCGEGPFCEAHRCIWDVDTGMIKRADLVVAYLEDVHAHGTLVEIGYAAALGKPIALGFSSSMTWKNYQELWLARMPAAKVLLGRRQDLLERGEPGLDHPGVRNKAARAGG